MAATTARVIKISKTGRVQSYAEPVLPLVFRYTKRRYAERCESCGGKGCLVKGKVNTCCQPCNGIGYFNIDPTLPTICPPGTEECIVVMRARRAAELPMVNPDDATLEGFRVDQTKFTPVSDLQGADSRSDRYRRVQNSKELPFEKAISSADEIIDEVILREMGRL